MCKIRYMFEYFIENTAPHEPKVKVILRADLSIRHDVKRRNVVFFKDSIVILRLQHVSYTTMSKKNPAHQLPIRLS